MITTNTDLVPTARTMCCEQWNIGLPHCLSLRKPNMSHSFPATHIWHWTYVSLIMHFPLNALLTLVILATATHTLLLETNVSFNTPGSWQVWQRCDLSSQRQQEGPLWVSGPAWATAQTWLDDVDPSNYAWTLPLYTHEVNINMSGHNTLTCKVADTCKCR